MLSLESIVNALDGKQSHVLIDFSAKFFICGQIVCFILIASDSFL
jgi:hypothetical protein